jgi:hypothetical protein
MSWQRKLELSHNYNYPVSANMAFRLASVSDWLFDLHRFPNNTSLKMVIANHISGKHESVTLCDGRIVTARQLYLEVLQVDPQRSSALNNLAIKLSGNESVELPDGRVMDERALLLESYQYDTKNHEALFNIARLMRSDESIELADGFIWTVQTIYKHLMYVWPKDRDLCSACALCIDDNERVIPCERRLVGKKDLLLYRIFTLGKPTASDYTLLAQCHDRYGIEEHVHIGEGNMANGRTLTVMAMQLDPKDAAPYIQLAILLRPNETFALPDDSLVDSKELLIRGLNCSSINNEIRKRKECDFDGVDEFNALKTACKMYDLCNFATHCLKKRLDVGESVLLMNGTRVSASVKRPCLLLKD